MTGTGNGDPSDNGTHDYNPAQDAADLTESELLAERIRTRRSSLSMTQADLEREAAIPRRSVSRYERGKVEPGLGPLRRLTRALRTTSDWLLGLVHDPAPRKEEPDEKDTKL